ncbi:efflux RND transporter permease subunit [Baaleninema simplex]|uniref:efflux RND transporter permease subunit n=1 Tax=Baaleninema simplex TaxID=2862350 RepID=UPI00034CBDD2|nr:efflux RND transporter permease subunit [Baaleninema simplex]
MSLSTWSVKRPVPTIVLFLVLSLVGLMSFFSLGIDDTPNIDVPVVQITVTQPGAGPAELESQVTQKVEDTVAGLGNIDELQSTVNDGLSITTITFDLGTDTDRATNDVRNAVSQIRQDLPQDINEPIVQRLEFAGGSIMSYAVRSPQRSVEELSQLVDRDISSALLQVSGVAQIDRTGGVDREIRIQLNPQRLQALGITATQVNDQIRAFNTNLSGGRSEAGGQEKSIRTLGSAPSVEDLQQYRIVLPSGGSVPLSSLGEVRDSYADPRQLAKFTTRDGEENVVAFSVLRSTGTSLVSVEEGVRQEVDRLTSGILPDDISIDLIFTRANEIRDSYQASVDALVFGCLLTTITVGFFLRDWRATLITGVALPLSIVPTFLVMQLLNYTLNGMTLLALALAVGNLVDDAICMIENIDSHLKMGKKPFNAALDAANEIGLAVVATTATIVAVFMPVAFMGGIPGQFFQPFGVTVAVSTMFSTLVATTMTPMLSAYLLKPKASAICQPDTMNPSPKPGPYRRVLTWALRNRVTTLIIAVVFFIASLQLVPYIPKGLFVEGDQGISTVNVELPPGATLQETERVSDRLTNVLLEHPATESVFLSLGSGGSESRVNEATITAILKPKSDREVDQQQYEDQIRPGFVEVPGARISFQSAGAGGGSKDLSIVLKSDNPEALMQAANDLESQMREIPGLVEVASSASLVKPEILITPDVERAADLGVSVQSIARTANLATLGDIEANLAKFDLPDRQIPIRVQIAEPYRHDLDTLRTLEIPTQSGSLVPLSSVAQITLGSGPAQIDRFDRSRQVAIEANLQGISLGDAVEAVQALPAMNPLPPGVYQQASGDAKIMIDVFSRFLGALAFAVLCIYAILVLLYNNFLYPLTILVALPLSIGGALLGLLIAQKELGLFALIGIVLLMGLVTKNAILLVDCALANEQQGLPQFKAVVEAGVSRLRPIFMTAISTIAGMLPIALEWGAGGEVRSPMAISVIGGFSTSTMLTLVVVPVLFTYIDNFNGSFRETLSGGLKLFRLPKLLSR